jgi:flagellar biosynthesis protein FlhF
MKIKRYLVNNMKEAVVLIKQDLGPDAIVISSQMVKEKGLKGWFATGKMEVTAAIEREAPAMSRHASGSDQRLALHKMRRCLADLEIDAPLADFLLKDIDVINNTVEEIRQELAARVASVFAPVMPRAKSTRIMAFIGAPGVGKTTTLAKIGAIYSLFQSFNIGFITIDTYRVGAIEQMQIYGDIIGASVDVVTTPAELKQAIDLNRDKDLILIDTAGRPSRRSEQLAELKDYLAHVDAADIYLVINAASKKRDMMRMLQDFKVIPYSNLIFTKIDETECPGSFINAAYATGLPIAYITTGQAVPDDIEVANPQLLAEFVMKDVI